MRLVVRCNAHQQAFLQQKITNQVEFIFSEHICQFEADAAMDLLYEEDKASLPTHIPVVVHAVITTLQDLPPNCIRINAWNSFLERPIAELAFANQNHIAVNQIFNALNWKWIQTPDIPGFMASRVVAMIINEAWFALEAGVSTSADIDIAMKLGTNYPMGPFEWGATIGIQNIYTLLVAMQAENEKYTPCTLLTKQITA
jgi:3-hydroxybutyryl-CoA dehydrogenase